MPIRTITAASRSISGSPALLALHGVVAKKDGTLVNIVIGEDENDPVVGISDLLIHLVCTTR